MHKLRKALLDLSETSKSIGATMALAWLDIKLRFRGSTLGPLWFTVSIGAQVAIIGYIYPKIFGIADARYIEWLGASLVCWQYISFCITDSVNVFRNHSHIYKNNKIPFTFFPMKSSFLGLYIFLLQLPVFFVIGTVFGFKITIINALLFLVGAALVFVFSFLINLLIGMLSLKFYDIPQIISIGMNLAFLVTPIIWMPEMAGSRVFFLKFNPFYYLIEILRSPLLGRPITAELYLGTGAILLVLGALTFTAFVRARSRIVFW